MMFVAKGTAFVVKGIAEPSSSVCVAVYPGQHRKAASILGSTMSNL